MKHGMAQTRYRPFMPISKDDKSKSIIINYTNNSWTDRLYIRKALKSFLSLGSFLANSSVWFYDIFRVRICAILEPSILYPRAKRQNAKKKNICIGQQLFIMNWEQIFDVSTIWHYMQKYNENIFHDSHDIIRIGIR